MFRKNLELRLQRIFGFKKTTFLAPSDTFEQDTLFIEIHSARSRVTSNAGGRETARVVGSLVVYSQGDRLPYGYFTKRIENAVFSDTKDLFFFEIDVDDPQSPARLQNIHERRTNFVFFYNAQYDPNKGALTSIQLSLE